MRSTRPDSLAPSETTDLEIRIGASTRLPRNRSTGARRTLPQALMLGRWIRFGRKENDGKTYGGCPLPANLWRMLAAALRQRPDLLSGRAEVVANVLRALTSRGDDSCALWDAPHRGAVVTLLRRLERAGVLARLLRRGVPVPQLLLHQARGGRYPALFLVDVLMPRVRARADRCDMLKRARGPGVSTGIVRMRDRGGEEKGWFSREERIEVDAMMKESVDAEMERWARSLLLVGDGEVRKLNEDEVQAIAHPPATTRKRSRGE